MIDIKIDRSTIKRNLNFGKDYFYQTGRVETTKTVATNNRIREYQIGGDKEILVSDRPRLPTDIPDGNIVWTQGFNLQKLYTLSPVSQYLFDYLPTDVVCEYCNHSFKHTELSSEFDDYMDDFRNNICPKCGVSECCEISYEHLTPELCSGIIG